MEAPIHRLLPLPRQVELLPGTFSLPANCRVVTTAADPEVQHVADHLVADLQAITGLHVGRAADVAAGDVELRLGPAPVPGDEAHVVHIDERGAHLIAPTAHGLWNASRTLVQLAPRRGAPMELPAVRIVDAPRFPWRGAMLDVARHFFGVDHVKRFIELIAGFKLNRLHLHLTDDQGWRLEVPRYPSLLAIGGSSAVGGGPGGWFTQADIREIGEHAARHHVTVVPEVDMPGHTHAALASLPELNPSGVAPPPYTGKDVGFSSLDLDLPATRDFVREVVATMAAATTGRYLHIGGDEAAATDPAQYAAFVALLQQEVQSHGRVMVGWEEIATHPLAPGTLVQHWLRAETALAAPLGARFVMSPARHTYLDMRHDPDDPLGRRWAGDIDLATAYGWDPAGLLPGVDDERIAGVEAPLWTEKVTEFHQVEHLCFPRLLALAEVGWTPQRLRSWADFADRAADHTDRLAARGVHVHR